MIFISDKQIVDTISNNPRLVAEWVKNVFFIHFNKEFVQPIKSYLQITENPYDRMIALPAFIKGENSIAGIKWIGSHSNNINKGLQRANALIILNNIETLAPEVILDGSFISSMRTLAVSMIVLDKFITNNSNIGIIGMGKLGKLHAKYLGLQCPEIQYIYCYSKTAKYHDVSDLQKVKIATNIKEILETCNVIITTTNAIQPYIRNIDIGNQVELIINLSLMDFHVDVIEKSENIIIDDWGQNITAKKVFAQGFHNGLYARNNVTELGDVLFGHFKKKKGRTFINVLGMGIEDIYVAKMIYDIVLNRA